MYVLILVVLDVDGDLVLWEWCDLIVVCVDQFDWVGYLLIIGVYGDYSGDWVDEFVFLMLVMKCGQMCVLVEVEWWLFGLFLYIF